MKILITGSTGFVGKHLLNTLIQNKHEITTLVRKPNYEVKKSIRQIVIKDLFEFLTSNNNKNKIQSIFENIEVIIHCAAKVHSFEKDSPRNKDEYFNTNTLSTTLLAKIAVKNNIKKFIFMSTVKVNGDYNDSNKPFRESDIAKPKGFYAESKYKAEVELNSFRKYLSVIVIRSPIVYGSGVGANFKKLMFLIDKKIPMPFKLVNNIRSMIYLENLIDFILICISDDRANNETFLIKDDENYSLKKIISEIANCMNKRVFMFSVPTLLLTIFFVIIGKRDLNDKLIKNLDIDTSKARRVLNWKPPFTMKEGLLKTIRNTI
tara:strand:+ start:26484 stop:27443 length:960 start_codon:yes stop_codon:yes gene_type:complete